MPSWSKPLKPLRSCVGRSEAVLDSAVSAIQQLNEQESLVVETAAGNAMDSALALQGISVARGHSSEVAANDRL